MNTKYFAVLFFIASTAATELIDPFHDPREECRKKAGLSVEQLAQSINHMETAGPYLICFATRLGVLQKDGLVDVHKISKVVAQVVPPNISGKLTAVCDCEALKSGAKTPVERIVAFGKCLAKRLPKELLSATGYFQKPSYPLLGHDACAHETYSIHHRV